MKREIRFRAWVKPGDVFAWNTEEPACGKMYTGFGLSDITSGREQADVFCENGTWEEPKWDKAVIMQFTGLKDRNGKDIYEGDILSGGDDGELGVVEWDSAEACFITVIWAQDEIETEGGADCGLMGAFCEADRVGLHERSDTRLWAKIEGNVWENPELLEVKK